MFNRTRSFATAALMVAFAVGCKTPTEPPPPVDACPNLPGFQAEGPCEVPKYSASLHVEAPGVGFTVYQGGPLTCNASMTEQNAPVGSKPMIIWLPVNGIEVVCATIDANRGPELVTKSDSIPITQLMSVGAHTVSVKGCNDTNGVCLTASSFPVNIDPEPKMLVYTLVEASYPATGCTDIWKLRDVAGSTPVRLTRTCTDKWDVQLSPDGKTLYFTTLQNLPEQGKLWRVSADAGGIGAVSYDLAWEGETIHVSNISLSPDGRMIAFTGVTPSGGFNLQAFVVDVDGSNLKRLLPDKRQFGSVAWMPNGREVVTNYFEDGKEFIVKVDVFTAEMTLILRVEEGHPLWSQPIMGVSADGVELLLYTIFTERQAVFLATDGSGKTQVLPRKKLGSPTFCPEHEGVCFRSSNAGLSRSDLSGGNEQLLFNHGFGWTPSIRSQR